MPGGILGQLSALNKRLSVNQKLSIFALGVVTLCGILCFVYLLRRDDYQLLFSNLDAADANSVVSKLRTRNIPYQLEDGGRAVAIPASRINEARLELATEGLPQKGRIGFEIFDQNSWTATDFTQKVNYRRALEGELERTILSLSEVSQARVHLVMAKESLFEDEREPAKASVIIKLHSGSKLSESRVAGIANLVAFGVEGLHPENVTIVDMDGNSLTSRGVEPGAEDDAKKPLRKKLEKELSQKVVSILEPLVGAGKVRATASVTLDYSESQQTEEIYDPQKTVVLSSQKSEERLGSAPAVGGVPGPAQPPGQAAQKPGADGRLKQSETVNYEVSKTVRQVKQPKGTIKQLSVAVVVDDKTVATKDKSGKTTETSKSLSSAEIDQITKLVSATVGFNAERGDSVIVENIPFSGIGQQKPQLTEPGLLDKYRNLLQPAMRYLLILLMFVLFYGLIFRPVKRKVFSYVQVDDAPYNQLAAATGDPEMVRQLESKMAQLKSSNQLALEKGAEESPASESDVIKQQLVELAKREPELVTRMIKNWLMQEV